MSRSVGSAISGGKAVPSDTKFIRVRGRVVPVRKKSGYAASAAKGAAAGAAVGASLTAGVKHIAHKGKGIVQFTAQGPVGHIAMQKLSALDKVKSARPVLMYGKKGALQAAGIGAAVGIVAGAAGAFLSRRKKKK